MFRRVMVANRGEIARRIIRTLNNMGIASVVVYSEADQKVPYLLEATEAVCIGPAAAKDSYLCQDAILEAALQTECEAIHPGFGFLSENALFAERCRQQKLVFIGPSPALISLMGDKAQAIKTMKALGVPVLEGSSGVIGDINNAFLLAEKIGYPVLLKARAGGGGKGMRLVEDARDFKTLFSQAQLEAESAFGDGELYVEKFIKNARHIEFQVLGDHYGRVVCLGERECSVQRKNQKLIEEAPANRFSEELRLETSTLITSAMASIGYTNAGTLEFLLSDDEKLYFMEMNTRIQVEHPVTELVTGLDIVEWQVRIACGEALNFSAKDININGAALECRINAENPFENFLPSPGRIEKVVLPTNDQKGPVRIDTHLPAEGCVVTPFYDSMLAKVITHGKTRQEAILAMKQTLENMQIDGIHTNINFQKAVVQHPDFVGGVYDCSFLEKHLSTILHTIGD